MAGKSVRKFSIRKSTWISFRAGPQGGLGYGGRESWDTQWQRLQLKDLLYLAISGRWRVVGWRKGERGRWTVEVKGGERESDLPAPGEGMNR